MPLELRRPAPAWMAAAAGAALLLLGGLWFALEWSMEGPEEARTDWPEHVWVGLGWIVPATLWLTWRRPRSRLHAFGLAMMAAAVVSAISLAVLFRFLAEDFGLPARISAILVTAMAAFLVLYQLMVAVLPAIVLQWVLLARPAAGSRLSSNPSGRS